MVKRPSQNRGNQLSMHTPTHITALVKDFESSRYDWGRIGWHGGSHFIKRQCPEGGCRRRFGCQRRGAFGKGQASRWLPDTKERFKVARGLIFGEKNEWFVIQNGSKSIHFLESFWKRWISSKQTKSLLFVFRRQEESQQDSMLTHAKKIWHNFPRKLHDASRAIFHHVRSKNLYWCICLRNYKIVFRHKIDLVLIL